MEEVARPVWAARRAVVALVAAAALCLVVMVAAVLCSVAVATSAARRDAITLAARLSDYDVGPPMVRSMSGDPVARSVLAQIVRDRAGDPMGRFRVWGDTGSMVYASDPSVLGPRSVGASELDAIAHGNAAPTFTPGNDLMVPPSVGTVEVYVPVRASQGRLVFELRYDAAQYRDRVLALAVPLIGLSVLPLLVLALICVPLVFVLMRRVQGDHAERSRLLQYALATSDRERGEIASGLHDNVVQNLAGAGYVLSALETKVEPQDRPAAQTLRSVVQQSVESLRTLMTDLHPGTLTATGLPRAISGMVEFVREAGFTVTSRVQMPEGVHDALAVALYRVIRERLTQLLRCGHHVHVELGPADPGIELRITDAGGAPPDDSDGSDELALALLRARVSGLGGTLTVTPLPGGGSELVVCFIEGVSEDQPDLPTSD